MGPAAAAANHLEPPRITGERHLAQLANGLTVCLLSERRAPVTTCALFYRAGSRDEAPGQAGTAHFLEHMMFKGSPAYPAGEIDRRTQALGGANNAFTSHDATAYYFDFAPDRWTEALAIEADRMAALTLTPQEVASERQVILEEIALYESEPWVALEEEVAGAFFGDHPYGRPVLGRRDELATVEPATLAAFHRRFYQPANAVLVVAGDVGVEALAAVETAFAPLPATEPPRRPTCPPPRPPGSCRHLSRRQGEVGRLLLYQPAPDVHHPDHPRLRLLLTLLAGGRASRLHRRLVDELQLAAWLSVELEETVDPGHSAIAVELVPGADPQRVEALLLAELQELAAAPPTAEELRRARHIAIADWVFGHQRVHDRALAAAGALALFDLDHPERQLRRMLAATAEELPATAGRCLDPAAGAVLGWSLPAARRR